MSTWRRWEPPRLRALASRYLLGGAWHNAPSTFTTKADANVWLALNKLTGAVELGSTPVSRLVPASPAPVGVSPHATAYTKAT
jgi:hypothetical protein